MRAPVPAAEMDRVNRFVSRAAYDHLVDSGHAPLEAAGMLSALGVRPDVMLELVEAKLPHHQVYSFDVEVSTHELLRKGVVAAKLYGSQYAHHRVVVSAETDHEAALLAAGMASCHGMVTAVHYRY